ncbi:MAG: AAA family ATPase [Synergistaceae bacterium]|nr:AAA family ATPase [Synergistaceae bacterium]
MLLFFGCSVSYAVTGFTWQPSSDHLCIDTDEAREVYTRIINKDFFEVEELKNHNIVKQLDAISLYYREKYGDTSKINTPERQELRRKVIKEFLSIGSAVKQPSGKYAFTGPVKRNFQLELVLGLPASGKSTAFVNPHSDNLDAFILDCDVIKELLPEYQETFGGAADAVHLESLVLMDEALNSFLLGEHKGTNIILPIVAPDFDELINKYIKPFEKAGYDVRAVFVDTPEKICMNWNVKRQLDSGRMYRSDVAFSFGERPKEVYERLKNIINARGKKYSEPFGENSSLEEAA